MADSESGKKPTEFATEQVEASSEEPKESTEESKQSIPQISGSHRGDGDPEDENIAMEGLRPRQDDDSARIPIDSSGMDPVDLGSREKITTEQPKSGKSSRKASKSCSIDFVDRDPNNLQEAVKVNFADIIAEPSGAHSFDTIWGTSYKVYSVTKYWLYRILTSVCGVPCALFWGIYFACLAFCGIWWIMPCIRAISIKMNFVSKLWSLAIRTCLDPVFESIGLILSRIRVMLTLRRD